MTIISRKRGLPFSSHVDTDARAVRSCKACAEPGTGADALQRPLRSRFQARLTASVRRLGSRPSRGPRPEKLRRRSDRQHRVWVTTPEGVHRGGVDGRRSET
jgi:hypothetical protein